MTCGTRASPDARMQRAGWRGPGLCKNCDSQRLRDRRRDDQRHIVLFRSVNNHTCTMGVCHATERANARDQREPHEDALTAKHPAAAIPTLTGCLDREAQQLYSLGVQCSQPDRTALALGRVDRERDGRGPGEGFIPSGLVAVAGKLDARVRGTALVVKGRPPTIAALASKLDGPSGSVRLPGLGVLRLGSSVEC